MSTKEFVVLMIACTILLALVWIMAVPTFGMY